MDETEALMIAWVRKVMNPPEREEEEEDFDRFEIEGWSDEDADEG